MLDLKTVSQFKKDFKKHKHKATLIEELNTVILLIRHSKHLPEKYKDHILSDNYKGIRECHVKPDLLLI